jgi:uncharacterized protein (DUF58 family)
MDERVRASGGNALGAVFSPGFLRKLDRLHLRVRRSLSTRPGNTPMPRGAQGNGIEIESHKSYDPGDDLRHLDWNAYGRLDQLLIKTFRAEREAPLHIFLDLSASMAAPAADGKVDFGIGLAASLAYVSVRNHDPVRVVALSEALPRSYAASPFFSHRQSLQRLREFLLALRAETALASLVARRFTVAAVRLLGPAERDPALLFRRAQVVDAETGGHRFITLSPANLARYRQALADHLSHLAAFCNRCGIIFSAADTAAGLEHSLFADLPAAGLIR